MKQETEVQEELDLWTKPELKREIKRLRALGAIEIRAERDVKEIKMITFGKTILILFNNGQVVEYSYQIVNTPTHITQESSTHWKVQSMSDKSKTYDVHTRKKDGTYFCTCPSFMYHEANCKHIREVRRYFP